MADAPIPPFPPEPPPVPERAAIGLIETMRAEGGVVRLLDLHMVRLGEAARHWQRPFDPDAVRARIPGVLRGGPDVARVRVVLGADGHADVTAVPFDGTPFATAAVYPEPLVEAGTWRCRFKTTAREHYSRAIAWARSVGVDEPVLVNVNGEVSEGARTNVWLREGASWVTPALASGGFGGIERAVWLATRGTRGVRVTPERLAAADAVWLCNAVRGRMPVRLVTPPSAGRA